MFAQFCHQFYRVESESARHLNTAYQENKPIESMIRAQ